MHFPLSLSASTCYLFPKISHMQITPSTHPPKWGSGPVCGLSPRWTNHNTDSTTISTSIIISSRHPLVFGGRINSIAGFAGRSAQTKINMGYIDCFYRHQHYLNQNRSVSEACTKWLSQCNGTIKKCWHLGLSQLIQPIHQYFFLLPTLFTFTFFLWNSPVIPSLKSKNFLKE